MEKPKQRTCPGKGKKCGRFLSNRDVDSHLWCSKCRGQDCEPGKTCPECRDWTDSQWNRYLSRRSFKKRKASSDSSSLSGSPSRSSSSDRRSSITVNKGCELFSRQEKPVNRPVAMEMPGQMSSQVPVPGPAPGQPGPSTVTAQRPLSARKPHQVSLPVHMPVPPTMAGQMSSQRSVPGAVPVQTAAPGTVPAQMSLQGPLPVQTSFQDRTPVRPTVNTQPVTGPVPGRLPVMTTPSVNWTPRAQPAPACSMTQQQMSQVEQNQAYYTCPVQMAEISQLTNIDQLRMPPPQRPLPKLHLIPGKDTPMTSFRKEINLKLQESREEQSRQMAALLHLTQSLVSSVTGHQLLLDQTPVESLQTDPEDPRTPLPVPDLSHGGITRPSDPLMSVANKVASTVSLATVSTVSQASSPLSTSEDHSNSPRAPTEFSLPSFQIPKITPPSEPVVSQEEVFQIHVEVDELEDGELSVIPREEPVPLEPIEEEQDSRSSRKRKRSHDHDRDSHHDDRDRHRSSHRHRDDHRYDHRDDYRDDHREDRRHDYRDDHRDDYRANHRGEYRYDHRDDRYDHREHRDNHNHGDDRRRERESSRDYDSHRGSSRDHDRSYRHRSREGDTHSSRSHSRHRSRDQDDHRDNRDHSPARSHRSRESEGTSRATSVPRVQEGDRRILQIIRPMPDSIQDLDDSSETDPKFLDVLSWINQQFPETIQEQPVAKSHGSLAESLYDQQPRTVFPSLPWSHGCIDASNRVNNILTGLLPNRKAAPLKIGKSVPNFDLNYKFYQIRDLPSISTASLNQSVEQMVSSSQRDSVRRPKIDFSADDLKACELIFRRSRVVTSALDWQLASAIKLLQAQCQETPSPLIHQTLRLLLSAAKSITQLQLEQTVGLTNTLLKRRDAVIQKLPKLLPEQDRVALRASDVNAQELFDEIIVTSASQHMETAIQREANLKVASQVSKPPFKKQKSNSRDPPREERFSSSSQSGAAGSGITRTVSFQGKGKQTKNQTPKGKRR